MHKFGIKRTQAKIVTATNAFYLVVSSFPLVLRGSFIFHSVFIILSRMYVPQDRIDFQ
ncbi:MAG: hypothetical protein ACI8RD_011696 [Bacillariaceae sp.]|jgi:hypothetical protein